MMTKKRKPFREWRITKFVKGLIVNKLQTLPVIGTIVTNAKEDTDDNPAGKIKLKGWDWFRIAAGVLVGYIMYRGLLTMDEISDIFDFVNAF